MIKQLHSRASVELSPTPSLSHSLVNKATMWLTAIAHLPLKLLLSWAPGFALADVRGLPILPWSEVGIGAAGGRGLG